MFLNACLHLVDIPVLYLEPDTVLAIHASIDKHPGGLLSRSNPLYILDALQDIGNDDSRNAGNMEKKAAWLLYNIITMHPFMNGNKRTAYVSAKTFLELNGWSMMQADEDIAIDFLLAISAGRFSLQQVEQEIQRVLIWRGV